MGTHQFTSCKALSVMNLKIIFVFALVVASTSAQGILGGLIRGIVDLLDGDDDPLAPPPAVVQPSPPATNPPPPPPPPAPQPEPQPEPPVEKPEDKSVEKPEDKPAEKPEDKPAQKSDGKPEQDECQERRIKITRNGQWTPFQWKITKVPRHYYTVRAHASSKFVTSKNACVDEEEDVKPTVLISKPKFNVEEVESKEMNPCELRARIMKRINDARWQWSLRPIVNIPRKCYTVRASAFASASSKSASEHSCVKVDEKPQISIDPVPQIDEPEIIKPAILIAPPPQIDEPKPQLLIAPPPAIEEPQPQLLIAPPPQIEEPQPQLLIATPPEMAEE